MNQFARPKPEVKFTDMLDKLIDAVPAIAKKRHTYQFILGDEAIKQYRKECGRGNTYRGYKIVARYGQPPGRVTFE